MDRILFVCSIIISVFFPHLLLPLRLLFSANAESFHVPRRLETWINAKYSMVPAPKWIFGLEDERFCKVIVAFYLT